jgi:hypothetical protein
MDIGRLQQLLFNQIKANLPPHLSFVQEVSDVLKISNDSAYRRIRGEKTISFEEVCKMAEHFRVSLDQFLNLENDSVIFSGKYISRDADEFEFYLLGMVKQLQYFNSFKQKELYYLNKDIPIFHHFMFPELASFKCYFWSRYNLNYPQFNKGKFRIDDFINIFNTTGKKISDLYLQIPSTEIWNLDCINTTIRQIHYYYESKIFASHEDIITIYNCLEKLVDHIEKQVEAGVKFPYGKAAEFSNVKYRVFVNEFLLGDNTIVIELDNTRIISLNHNVINYIMTRDEKFVNYTFNTLQTLLKKSTLISEVGERERQLFFDGLRERIHSKKKEV